MGPLPDGRWAAVVPGQAASAIMQFYVEARDLLDAVSVFPPGGPDSRALVKWDDGLAATNGLHNIRIILTPADRDWFHTNVNLMSNDYLGCTVIYGESETFYDAGVRAKGSQRGRPVSYRFGFALDFQREKPLRGVYGSALLDRSQGGPLFGQREMLMNVVMTHVGSVAGEYNDLVQVLAPKLEHTGTAELQLDRAGDLMLDTQFGSGGGLFEYELVYYPTTTVDGTPEGAKLPNPDLVVGTAVRDLGDDPEAYRYNFMIKANRRVDDYRPLVAFAKAMGQTGATFQSQIGLSIDVDQWLQSFALATLSGAVDHYAASAQHNAQFYQRPDDGRFLYFPHDLDFYQSDPRRPIVSCADLSKLLAVPAYARRFYGHLNDVIATTYNATYLAHWRDHFGALLPGQDFVSYYDFAVARSDYVLRTATDSVWNSVPPVAFAITTNGGADFAVDDVAVTLAGDGWVDVHAIVLGAAAEPLEGVTWSTRESWQVTLPLALGANVLELTALDRRGAVVGSDTITVTSTFAGP
jgi:hypothetical protein